MAKDYARRRTTTSKTKAKSRGKKRSSVSRWFWLAVIIMLGGFAAFLLILSRSPSKAELEALAPRPSITSVKPQETTKSMPKFEFYDILPEKQITPPKPPEEPEAANATTTAPATYWVQIAAFPNFIDADALKAELALLGFPATIEQITLDGQNWFRVRSGPFTNQEAAKVAQTQLQEASISSQIVTD